jgi:hypothetical protein
MLELEQELALLQKAAKEAERPNAHAEPPAVLRSASIKRSVRDLVLESLDEIGFPVYSQQLALLIRALFGREVPATRFGTLSVDEERTFARAAPRSVWLAHGLTFDRAEPIKRIWARSDWPLEQRVVTPIWGRVQQLRLTARLAELAMEANEIAANPDLLRYLAADYAQDLGVKITKGKFFLDQWRDLALEQLQRVVDKDLVLTEQAASAWPSVLSGPELLFGRRARPELVVVPVGTATGERQA